MKNLWKIEIAFFAVLIVGLLLLGGCNLNKVETPRYIPTACKQNVLSMDDFLKYKCNLYSKQVMAIN